MALGVAFTAALYLAPGYGLVATLGALISTAALTLLDPGEIPAAGARLGAATFSVLYVGGLAAPLALLQRDAAHGRAWVLLAIGVTFGNDTGAYFGGRGFGRHKLYPKVSPAKTVEGAIGGLVASLLIMFVVRATAAPWLTVGDCLAVGLPAAVLGPIGDLVESLMKRAAGVKDSGHLIPGARRHARPDRRPPLRRRLDLHLRRPPETGPLSGSGRRASLVRARRARSQEPSRGSSFWGRNN